MPKGPTLLQKKNSETCPFMCSATETERENERMKKWTNKWFIELGCLPMSQSEAGDKEGILCA